MRHTNDPEIRAALRSKLSRRHADGEAIIVDELPVDRGSARVDVAVIRAGIEGYEIKSSRDSLFRLPRQVKFFSAAMDRMTLVCAEDHLDKAISLLPDWWAVAAANPGPGGKVTITRVRAGRRNPAPSPRARLRMLERPELVSLLTRHSLDRGFRSATWTVLAERAEALLPATAILGGTAEQLMIRAALEARFSRTAFGASALGGGLTLIEGSTPP